MNEDRWPEHNRFTAREEKKITHQEVGRLYYQKITLVQPISYVHHLSLNIVKNMEY